MRIRLLIVEYQNDRGINIVIRLLYCIELCQKNEGTENSIVGSLDPLNYMNVGMTRTESLPLQVQYPTRAYILDRATVMGTPRDGSRRATVWSHTNSLPETAKTPDERLGVALARNTYGSTWVGTLRITTTITKNPHFERRQLRAQNHPRQFTFTRGGLSQLRN